MMKIELQGFLGTNLIYNQASAINSSGPTLINFNFLGVAVNYELDAVVQDRALAQEAQQMFLDDLENSVEITLRSRLVAP